VTVQDGTLGPTHELLWSSDFSADVAESQISSAQPVDPSPELHYTIQVEQLAFDLSPGVVSPVSSGNMIPSTPSSLGTIALGAYVPGIAVSLPPDRITAGSSSVGTAQLESVAQEISTGEGAAGSLPLRSSAPMAGKLTEGPTTRTVDLHDALAFELAWLLTESGFDESGNSDNSQDGNYATIEVAIPGVEHQATKPTERLANGLVLVGVDWPQTPQQMPAAAPLPLLGASAENNAGGLQNRTNLAGSEPALTDELRNASDRTKNETEERNQALRTGLTIAYGLAFMFLLPDLTSFLQGRRRIRRSKAQAGNPGSLSLSWLRARKPVS
jgi:hypothetical protein